MIIADVVLDEAGLLQSCAVDGHAGAGPFGDDLVCAAVTVLTRTVLRTLASRGGISVSGSAPNRGSLVVKVDGFSEVERGFLDGVTTVLVEGLGSVARDYPDHCNTRIRTERRHGNGS